MPAENWIIDEEHAGSRLDKCLAELVEGLSRTAAQRLIDDGHVMVNGAPAKSSQRLELTDRLEVNRPEVVPSMLIPEEIPLEVLYEDEEFIAINKAPGMVVHPAPGHSSGTLVHALLSHCDDLSGVGGEERPLPASDCTVSSHS